MSFGWSTAATAVSDPSSLFNNVAALAWTAPTTLGAEGAVDGTAAANRVLVSAVTVSGISWAPGTDLWLRWTDPQASGVRDDGMALDDLSFSAAVPEPGSASLLLVGVLAAGAVRSNQRKA
jgi:PEP-CTERM motif